MSDFQDNKALIDLARATLDVQPLTLAGVDIASVPRADGGRDIVSLEKFREELRDAPKRIKGTATAATVASFIDLVNRHKDAASALFGAFSTNGGALTAVIDYPANGASPRFGQHRIRYAFPVSPEWAAWSAADGKTKTQTEWAEFIEDRIADLAAPDDAERSAYEGPFSTTIATPAELITLSRGLAVTAEARVKQTRVLSSGEVEISYEEVHKDASGDKLRVPGLFIVRIPLFVGDDPTRLLARLRYRVKDGKIVWFYQFCRADVVVLDAMVRALEDAAKATALPAFEGSPEA